MPLTVRTGEQISINCSASGEQPIYINWHSEDNRPLPPYVRVVHNFLEFSRITPNDAGRYYCTATNRHGNVTKAAEVIVKNNEITDNRQPTQYGRVQEVIEGETVSLECHEETTPGARVSKILFACYLVQSNSKILAFSLIGDVITGTFLPRLKSMAID